MAFELYLRPKQKDEAEEIDSHKRHCAQEFYLPPQTSGSRWWFETSQWPDGFAIQKDLCEEWTGDGQKWMALKGDEGRGVWNNTWPGASASWLSWCHSREGRKAAMVRAVCENGCHRGIIGLQETRAGRNYFWLVASGKTFWKRRHLSRIW